MATNKITLGPVYIPDPTIGRPISGAQLFIGEPGLVSKDFQKQVSIQQEDGDIVAIAQPLQTGAGGVILYQGSPVIALVDGQYSMQILDSNDAQIYYVPKSQDLGPLLSEDSAGNGSDRIAWTGRNPDQTVTEGLDDHEARITVNEADIATNTGDISTLQGQVVGGETVSKAWVNWGTTQRDIAYSRSGTTVTITDVAHGLSTSDVLYLTFEAGTGGTATSGSESITVLDVDTYTVTDAASGVITGGTGYYYISTSVINDQFNVSSITDNADGDFTVNFDTDLVDANYAWSGGITGPLIEAATGTAFFVMTRDQDDEKTASLFRVKVSISSSGELVNPKDASVIIFGGNA